ncbi:MAG: lactonase family protein [Solirubrobacteraceae bacterium]
MLVLGNSHHVRRLSAGALLLAAAGLAATAPAATAKNLHVTHRVTYARGAVFTETNAAAINEVVVFNRGTNGRLTMRQSVPTGGSGLPSPACAAPPGLGICPIADAQGEVNVSSDGRLVFAVNAGSNTISSFLETAYGLILVDRKASDGTYPVSLDSHGNTLYVLNQVSGNIAGFRFAPNGRLYPIPGSSRSLATPGPMGAAAQISFDRTGRSLAVTERATSQIDTFTVTGGVAGPATAHPTPAGASTPFGFAFDRFDRLVVSDALSQTTGAATTYRAVGNALTAIDTKSTNGGAPCWVVITPDNRYVYISNTTTKTIARFALGSNGSLTLLGLTPTLGTPPGPIQFPTDEALSKDGRFLYVLIPSVFGGSISRIDQYRIGTGGSLTLLGSTPANMPAAVSGLAAR